MREGGRKTERWWGERREGGREGGRDGVRGKFLREKGANL